MSEAPSLYIVAKTLEAEGWALGAHVVHEAVNEIERLRRLLAKHGSHTSNCRWGGGFDCDCGWQETQA